MSTRDAAVHRLESLRAQFAEGERTLAGLDSQREHLVANLLRLSGAVQVLEEVLEEESSPGPVPLRAESA
jgi:ABC-type transporter Mla subunit MlaD